MRAVELFVGAGGLGLATSRAGFSHDAVIELDHDACSTLRENKERGVDPVKDWPIHEQDVREFPFKDIRSGLDLVAGGPPCQPFSLGGKHAGHRDTRNLFPETVKAVRELRPRGFVFENVRGLLRESFVKYFEYIILQLSHPEITRKAGEEWRDHQGRLERHHTRGKFKGLHYNVVFQPLNAADFGVPQRRDRVFIVGFRSDLEIAWNFPLPTHSYDALLHSQFVTGEYFEEHRVAKKRRPAPPDRMLERVEQLGSSLFPPTGERWRTVRDAISGLPAPSALGREPKFLNHTQQPGARPYVGHTGSLLDEPAKTLKAGDHGVPGGENMVALPDGRTRYFTVRESARLQTFPDDFAFTGAWSECMRQLGNAVPVDLGYAVVKTVAGALRRKG